MIVIKIYIVPEHEATYTDAKGGTQSLLGPKYFRFWPDAPPGWTATEFNAQDLIGDLFVVACEVDLVQHAFISSQADAIAVNDDLDAPVGLVAANRVSAFLENKNLPGNWVGPGLSSREILKTILGIFQTFQRIRGMTGKAYKELGITLNGTFATFPPQTKKALQDVATHYGWDTASLTGATTGRQILKFMADQWVDTPLHFGRFITL